MAESVRSESLPEARADVSRNDQFNEVFEAELQDIRARRTELFPSEKDAGGLVDRAGLSVGSVPTGLQVGIVTQGAGPDRDRTQRVRADEPAAMG